MSLRELLDEEAGFDCEYGGGLSNHRPMALAALTRLGANNQQLTSFDAAYRQRLRPAPAHEDWPTGDAWASRLGDPAAWPVYRSLFAQWLEHEAAGDVLQQVLPRLTQGVGAAAFHGLIRTAYAVQSAHRQELADALAYWACRHLPLGEARTQQRAALDVEPALDRLPRLRAGGGLIFERMRSAAAQPGFSAATATLVIDESTLHRLAHHAAAMYTMSGSFTVLHLVTSAHAMRVLLPFVDDPLAAVGDYWRAYAASVSATALKFEPAPSAEPWPHIVSAALNGTDDHLIKLVDSCREQEQALGGEVWRAAATRVLR